MCVVPRTNTAPVALAKRVHVPLERNSVAATPFRRAAATVDNGTTAVAVVATNTVTTERAKLAFVRLEPNAVMAKMLKCAAPTVAVGRSPQLVEQVSIV